MSVVTRLRRSIDDPGDFLDWLISIGWAMEDAALLISVPRSVTTQQLLRRFDEERSA